MKKLELLCDDVEITTQRVSMNSQQSVLSITVINVDDDSIMDNLNFEDVMNYYGVMKVLEWAEGNK